MIFDYSGHLTGLGVFLLLVGLAAFILIWIAIVVIWAGHKYIARVRASEHAAKGVRRVAPAEQA